MGLVLQRQRRAAEFVFTELEFTLEKSMEFYLGSEKIYLIGISKGVGTCSDRHGINLAVFSRIKPKTPVNCPLNFPICCSGLVLLRELTENEYKKERESRWHNDQPLLVVEGLVPLEPVELSPTKQKVGLSLNGRKTSYVVLV